MDASPQAQRDEALNGGRQLRILKVVIKDAGRARVSHEVGIALLHAVGGEPPVPLCAALPTRVSNFDTDAIKCIVQGLQFCTLGGRGDSGIHTCGRVAPAGFRTAQCQ